MEPGGPSPDVTPPPEPGRTAPRKPSHAAGRAAGALYDALGRGSAGPGLFGLVAVLVAAGAAGIWALGAAGPGEGRLLAGSTDAPGDESLRLVARKAGDGEIVEVRRGRERLERLGVDDAVRFERFELTSDRLDVGGGPAPDVVIYGWTGGMACCITHFVIDGDSGRLLGRIEQGAGDPSAFVPPAEGSSGRPLMPLMDDVAAGAYGGSEAETPMGRVLVGWLPQERRFGLDLDAMRAQRGDAPPAYWTANPGLAMILLDTAAGGAVERGAGRGAMARAYADWVEAQVGALRDATLDPLDPASFVPLARVLDAYVYKGRVEAGLVRIRALKADQPEGLEAGLKQYFAVLAESRWFDDLDRLNNGALTREVNAAGQ